MPLDPHVARFLALLAASGTVSTASVSVDERRRGLAALMKFSGPPPRVACVDTLAVPGRHGPIPIRVYTPIDSTGELLAGLVYFHGGGLVAGSILTHDALACELADAGRCKVVSVDYRLAPEHPFPAAVDDALSATVHIAENAAAYGIDGTRLGVCGDSAGATLAAATAHTMTRTCRHPLGLQLLLCPILDWSRPTPSRRELAHGFLVDQEMLDHDLRHYVPAGCSLSDPRISPLCAENHAGLPVTFIHTAEYDPLRDEGAEYAARLSAAGCRVSLTCHAGMIHLFYGLQSVVPYARRGFEQIGLQIRGTLETG